jgi:transposase
MTALLEALAAIEGQIARLDEQLKELARRSPVCWRLMSVPGVGPIMALSLTRRPRPRKRLLEEAFETMLSELLPSES